MFDSGFGGLTVARALMDLAPQESIVYFGDTGRYPYGPRPHHEVLEFSLQIAEFLVREHDPKLLVVACNTATSVALDALNASLDVPVIGVVEPGLRSLLAVTQTGRVGVIATTGTVASGAYQRAVSDAPGDAHATVIACPGFVEFVERGETDSEQVRVLAQRLLAPVIDADVDALLLGCTHYPFLARPIGEVMGRSVTLVSSADETAFAVVDALGGKSHRPSQSAPPSHTFVSSGDSEVFVRLGRSLLGPELTAVQHHGWD